MYLRYSVQKLNVQISDTTFGQVPVRVYEPLTKEPNGAAIVWIHGGGWIVGSVGGCSSIFFRTMK